MGGKNLKQLIYKLFKLLWFVSSENLKTLKLCNYNIDVKVVCVKEVRPEIPGRWNSNITLRTLYKVGQFFLILKFLSFLFKSKISFSRQTKSNFTNDLILLLFSIISPLIEDWRGIAMISCFLINLHNIITIEATY